MILTAAFRPFLMAQTPADQYECTQTAYTISFILGMPALWSRLRSCESNSISRLPSLHCLRDGDCIPFLTNTRIYLLLCFLRSLFSFWPTIVALPAFRFPHTFLLVGCCGDTVTHAYKGKTVMTQEERYESLRHCRWVDEVVEEAPWVIGPDFLAAHQIHYVAHDDLPYADTNARSACGQAQRTRLIHSKGGGCIWSRYADASGSADDVYEFVSGDGEEAGREEAELWELTHSKEVSFFLKNRVSGRRRCRGGFHLFQVKKAGRFKATKRTEGISTSDLILRITREYSRYVMRNLKRGYTGREMGVSALYVSTEP